MNTITAKIPARKIGTKTYQARVETFSQDDAGHWTITTDGMNEPVFESEVLDMCRRATNWQAIRQEHFRMEGFHS
jgi:hypothetical protein